MILGIIDKLNEWIEPAKAFIENNHSNPILWVALFLIGLAVFALTYGALNKNQ
ncbi:MAG: hypothetical protein HFH45_06010 [Bacilli bacterium]|nr:hypothetical protein [Bacilli bacterium]